MHTLFGLSSMLLVLLGCSLAFMMLQSLHNWSLRRTVQLFILASPFASLGLSIGGLHHFTGKICLFPTPSWDYLLGVVLPFAMGLVALGALGLGFVRLMLMARVVGRAAAMIDPELQTIADALAQQFAVSSPRVLLLPHERPLAFTCGFLRPTILLASWMVEHLDRRELEAVLAHELEHVARHDYFVTWLAMVLRDAFFYLPTSQVAYRQIQREKELACDDLAVRVTQRPLALASALTKVWQYTLEGSLFADSQIAQPLYGNGQSINDRVERLLAASPTAKTAQSSYKRALAVKVVPLLALLLVEGMNAMLVLASVGCDPFATLLKLL